jgi:GNAT superfamily N-acetyltransferase
MEDISISAPQSADYAGWRRLYQDYATFYKMPMDDAIAGRVWAWLLDPAYPLEALLARSAAGAVVGLAHFRPMPRPLTGTTAGFLDDLFVAPELRGRRVADGLIAAMAELGRARGWTVIRWLTADDNYRARGVYDRVAKRTMWITYQMDLTPRL